MFRMFNFIVFTLNRDWYLSVHLFDVRQMALRSHIWNVYVEWRAMTEEIVDVGVTVTLHLPHELLYSSDSMLNGLRGMMLFCGWWCESLSPALSRPLVLSRRGIEQSSGSSSESSPTTSICTSSSSKSDSDVTRCWDRYSARSDSMSTVMPLARSFRACRSRALASFFLRRAL